MSNDFSNPIPVPRWIVGALARPWTYALTGIIILLLDLLSGPFLLFPILFVLPISLSAWFCSARLAYVLAVLLPVGRFFIADLVEHPQPFVYVVANAIIRIAVLLFLAILVVRTAQQTKQLQERVAGLITICAWSRTVEYNGEWISFEEYLKRRFDIHASHGISPAEAQRVFGEVIPSGRKG